MTETDLDDLFAALWHDYVAINPNAQRIHDLFAGAGDRVVNDHIALRTFSHPRVNIDKLAAPFVAAGYRPAGAYRFREKKLFARHYEHASPERPKVFISELLLEQLSPALQDAVAAMVAEVPQAVIDSGRFPVAGRPWHPITFQAYRDLLAESEYAAWLYIYGYRANHFTVRVNALKRFASLAEVNEFLERHGYQLNESGGKIKGSPAVYLEQSSTLADKRPVVFEDGVYEVPSCYYEFAMRHRLPSGEEFSGFIEGSADKIFESTNHR